MEIFVTGATGAVGRPLASTLVESGHDVIAATRRPSSYTGTGRPLAFDLDHDADLDPGGAARRADAAYYLVHALADPDFADLDRRRAERFATWWGPDRPVVYLGGLGLDGTASAHLRSRHEVGRILRARCRTVELRASLVIGADSLSFRLLARLGRLASHAHLPCSLPVPTAATTRTQPVGIDDLVAVLLAALDLAPGSYDVGGPEVLSYQHLLERSAGLQGRTLRTRAMLPIDAAWAGPAAALAAGTDPWATTALFSGMGSEAIVRPGHGLPRRLRPTTGLDHAITAALRPAS